MRIEIEFDTEHGDNTDHGLRAESARLVHLVATLLGAGETAGRFHGRDGESVGTWAVTDPD